MFRWIFFVVFGLLSFTLTAEDVNLERVIKAASIIERESRLGSHDAWSIALYIERHPMRGKDVGVEDVLAVMKVESNFNPRAVSRSGAKGLMQIHRSSGRVLTVDIRRNLDQGLGLLSEYRREGKSMKAALHMYNVGIGSYKRGKRNHVYVNKVMKQRDRYARILGGSGVSVRGM